MEKEREGSSWTNTNDLGCSAHCWRSESLYSRTQTPPKGHSTANEHNTRQRISKTVELGYGRPSSNVNRDLPIPKFPPSLSAVVKMLLFLNCIYFDTIYIYFDTIYISRWNTYGSGYKTTKELMIDHFARQLLADTFSRVFSRKLSQKIQAFSWCRSCGSIQFFKRWWVLIHTFFSFFPGFSGHSQLSHEKEKKGSITKKEKITAHLVAGEEIPGLGFHLSSLCPLLPLACPHPQGKEGGSR